MSCSVSSILRPGLLAAVLALALAACGSEPSGGADADVPAQVPSQVAAEPDHEPEPRVPEHMPTAGLEPDGRTAPWVVAVQIGATMHALSEACGQHEPAELRRMQAGQREEIAGHGVDVERFDAVWDWAGHQAREKIAAQPAAELESGCARLIEMEEEAQRMGDMMRQMSMPPP